MPYIKVFETDDKSKFREACAILRKESIKHEVLYEYRLFLEKRHDPLEGRGAVIRVPRSVFHDADRLLSEKGIKKNQERLKGEVPLMKIIEKRFPQRSSATKVMIAIFAFALLILSIVLLFFGLLTLA